MIRRLPPGLLVRLAAVGLWGLVGVAVVTSAAALAVALQPPAAQTAAPPPPTAATGFAEMVVTAHVTAREGDAAALRALTGFDGDLDGVRGAAVQRTAVLDARLLASGRWAVLVAVEVGAPPPAFYEVTVVQDGAALTADGLPRRVAGPAAAQRPASALPALAVPSADDPAVVAAAAFLTAYLTGDGDLDRYTPPGSGLRAVTPPSHRALAVRRWAQVSTGAGAVVAVAEVSATAVEGRVEVLHYPLRLRRRDGRWEVTDLLPAPPLAAG